MNKLVKEPIEELHLSKLCQPRRLLGAASRCLFVTLSMAAGLGALAFLAEASYVSSTISIREETAAYAINVAIWSMLPMLFVSLQVEFQLLFVLSLQKSWSTCQVLFPLVGGFAGAFLGWFLFPQPEHGPKETMLISGAALLLFTGVSMQLALWTLLPQSRVERTDFPKTWFAIMVLLSATFLGAMRGWTDAHPHLKHLLEYREEQWVKKQHPPLPLPDLQEPIIVY